MKKPIIVFAAIALLITGCAKQKSALPDYRESKPQKAVIYTDGVTIVEEKIEKRDLVEGGLILPDSLDLETMTVYQDDTRLKYYTIEKRTVQIPGGADEGQDEVRNVIAFPEYDGKSALTLRYSISGINWTPKLEAEIKDGKALTLYLTAVIASEVDELTGCDITLMNASSRNKSSAVEDVFKIGQVALNPGRTVFYLLSTETVSYATYYSWMASTEDTAKLIFAFESPFSSTINQCPFTMTADNVVMNQGIIAQIRPRKTVELESGSEPLIKTYRAVTTKQDINKKVLAFNHAVALRTQNLMGSPIELRVYFIKKLGEINRNQYRYLTPPDEQPGEWMLWNLKLDQGGVKDIKFNFDSDTKNFNEYLGYDYFEGGR